MPACGIFSVLVTGMPPCIASPLRATLVIVYPAFIFKPCASGSCQLLFPIDGKVAMRATNILFSRGIKALMKAGGLTLNTTGIMLKNNGAVPKLFALN
jgi:hypothetical protein